MCTELLILGLLHITKTGSCKLYILKYFAEYCALLMRARLIVSRVAFSIFLDFEVNHYELQSRKLHRLDAYWCFCLRNCNHPHCIAYTISRHTFSLAVRYRLLTNSPLYRSTMTKLNLLSYLNILNMEHQLDSTITVLLISKTSSTGFGHTFAHLQERKTEDFTTYGTMSCKVGKYNIYVDHM
jgi:hypothetical protein